jgi:hypothetical protein
MSDWSGPVSRGFPDGFRTEKVLVTPPMARNLLSTMHVNRALSRVEVSVQEQNIDSGNWFPEISPVFLDDDPGSPRSWDAQHRLEAVCNTGVATWMLFIYGVGSEAAEYIDTGRKRLYADNLKRRGTADYKRVSVLAKYTALYEMYGMEAVRSPSKFAVSQAEMDKRVNAPGTEMLDSIRVGEMLYRATGANPSWAAYAAYRTGQGTDPDGFFRQVASGEDMRRGNPALTLNKWLLQGGRRSRRPADKRLMEMYAFALCWNKHVKGEEYYSLSPRFETRRDGSKYFPSSSVPDFEPLAPGTYDVVPFRKGKDDDLAELRAAFARAGR